MNSNGTRISSLARSYNVLSKDVIDIANMTGESVKSASSKVIVGVNNRIYWDCVLRAAQNRRENRASRGH